MSVDLSALTISTTKPKGKMVRLVACLSSGRAYSR